MNDTFRFILDADIQKSSDSSDSPRIIRGYASTEDKDRQEESLVQKGLDISDFVNYGYFNYDHDNSVVLGYPYKTCRVDSKGFWVEGELLKGIPVADRIWNLAVALKKSNAPRKVGFSVEGKVMQRSPDSKKILKAKIYNVAITTNPVNTNCTWDAVAKSFAGQQAIGKSLEAGYEINPTDMEGGATFRAESLERDFHNLSYIIDDENKKEVLKKKLKEKETKKSLTARELVLYLQLTKGWSQYEAFNFIKSNKLSGGAL